MENKAETPPITDFGSMNIHLSYLRRDVTDLKADTNKSFEEIKKTLNTIGSNYVTVFDFAEHLKLDEDHEKRIRALERYSWIAVGALAVLQLVLKFFLK